MTFRTPSAGRPGRAGRPRLLVPVLVAVFALIVLLMVFTGIWTDYLWFRSVRYTSVFTTEMLTKISLFVISGVLMAGLVGLNIFLAYRLRPAFRPLSLEQQGLERYRAMIDPHRRLALIGVVGVLGLLAGSSVAGAWRVWLMFANQTPFGVDDAQFGRDIAFYTFTYPFIRLALGFAFAAVLLSVIGAAITHYLYGGIRLQSPGDRVSGPARAHLSVLIGVFVLLKAIAYWYDRYGLAFSERGFVAGPSYTDVNAVLPGKTILVVIAVICAGLFFAAAVRPGGMLPAAGFGLLALSAILVGGVYPALIQQFQVKPNEADREAKYIQRNIAATRTAFGVADTEVIPYSAQTKLSPAQRASEAATISGVRLLDPAVVSPTFQQLQQVRNFYRFPDTLDIDRYPQDGAAARDTVVAVREVSGAPAGRQNWINDHLVYTHGFGLVAASGSKVAPGGTPDFVEKDIPPTGTLGLEEPRVYFGERSPAYSIVGGPRGTAPRELDYPDESAKGQQNNTYAGRGGVPIGSFGNRLLYAMKYREKNILLSGAINAESKILYIREPRERVAKVAPYLTLDGDPYPAVVGGRIMWILDGYTTSDGYPYSERVSLADETRDTITETRSAVAQLRGDRINYMRNSVKVVVDSFDGTVTLYQWDDRDPVLRTWMKAFPDTVRPKSEIGEELMRHLRYPQDLFKVQRSILARYHVQDAQSFYGGQDYWEVPQDPTRRGHRQPPYYLSLKMPEESGPAFSLTTVFNPRGRPNLAGFMAADATPGEDYGRIRILELPRNSPIQGPGQVQNSFESNPTVKEALNRLRLGNTQAVLGNLLTLPFAGGLLYVEPVYGQAGATESEPYPILRHVLVLYGNDVGIGDNLQAALNQVFTGAGTEPPPEPPGDGQQPPPTEPPDGGTLSPELRQALADAQKAYQDGLTALRNGDFAAYDRAQRALKEALDRAARAAGQTSGTQPSPSPSPTTTTTISPTPPSPTPSTTPSA